MAYGLRCYYYGIFKDGSGKIVPSGTVTVYLSGTSTLASIYTSLTGTTAVNSVTTSSTDGSFEFWVDRFDYDSSQKFTIILSKPGYTSQTIENVNINSVVLGTYTISADLTVTTDIYVPSGVLFSVASGKTLTLNGIVEAGPYQIFTGDGTVTVGTATILRWGEWWGTSTTGIGTRGQALTSGGSATQDTWQGMTTQGDVEYHNGTTRTRLAVGTAYKSLKTAGSGANPSWAWPLEFIDVRGSASINAAVTAIGSTETTLVVPNAQTLTANLIVPSTLSLIILKGGSIVKASTYTLTINGPFEAGLYQVFSGFNAGDVSFGPESVTEIREEWFADDDKAIASYPYTGWGSLTAPVVTMFRVKNTANDGTGGIWKVYVPGGVELDTTGTTTDGLQEAINYACRYGYDLYVYGGTYKPGNWPAPYTPGEGTDVSIIYCTSAITIPPVEKLSFQIQNTSLIFATNVLENGITFDSGVMINFVLTGQIGYAGNASAVRIYPNGALPYSAGGPGMADCRFVIAAIAIYGGTNPKGVIFDTSVAGINNIEFDVIEINGGQYGIFIDGANGFSHNNIKCPSLHAQTEFGIALDNDAVNGVKVWGNTIDVKCEPATGGSGIDIWGIDNIIDISVGDSEGVCNTGIKLEASAVGNIIRAGRLTGSAYKIQDISTLKSNIIHYKRDFVSVHKNAVSQDNIVTATWTKVTWSTEAFDTAGTFASDKWTPGIVGRGRISARIGWSLTTVDKVFVIAVYQNNVAHKLNLIAGRGLTNGEGSEISIPVMIGAETDYFEIFVYHNAGENRDIAGAASLTYAFFERID